ncbi:MAG: DegV family protein [Clostridiaceae bacterium]|nr:DegV family protein [Clostridiaceae bacterium]
MSTKIVADSCCDLNDEIKKNVKVSIVPAVIHLEGETYKDDESLDVAAFLKKMRNSKEVPKTACPSPQEFIEKYKGEEDVFVVTVSSALSGTYKSAVLARDIFFEQVGKKFIHIFDSLSASVGETLISLKIHEFVKGGHLRTEIVDKVNRYIKEMKTFFVLENLDNLMKAGRISPMVAKVSNILNIRLIMAGTEEGTIRLHEKVVGAKRAIKRLAELIGEQSTHLEDKVLGIAHCNCLEKALKLKEEVMKRYKFKDIIIVETAGVSTVYANEGGLIIAF